MRSWATEDTDTTRGAK